MRIGVAAVVFLTGFGAASCSFNSPDSRTLSPEQQQRYEQGMRSFDEHRKSTDEARADLDQTNQHGWRDDRQEHINSLLSTTYSSTIPTALTDATTHRRDQEHQGRSYVRDNYDTLVQEMAQGRGDFVAGLLTFLCGDMNIGARPMLTPNTADRTVQPFQFMVREDFDALVPREKDPDRLWSNIKEEMHKHYAFVKCSL